jgi:hypothetical protein
MLSRDTARIILLTENDLVLRARSNKTEFVIDLSVQAQVCLVASVLGQYLRKHRELQSPNGMALTNSFISGLFDLELRYVTNGLSLVKSALKPYGLDRSFLQELDDPEVLFVDLHQDPRSFKTPVLASWRPSTQQIDLRRIKYWIRKINDSLDLSSGPEQRNTLLTIQALHRSIPWRYEWDDPSDVFSKASELLRSHVDDEKLQPEVRRLVDIFEALAKGGMTSPLRFFFAHSPKGAAYQEIRQHCRRVLLSDEFDAMDEEDRRPWMVLRAKVAANELVARVQANERPQAIEQSFQDFQRCYAQATSYPRGPRAYEELFFVQSSALNAWAAYAVDSLEEEEWEVARTHMDQCYREALSRGHSDTVAQSANQLGELHRKLGDVKQAKGEREEHYKRARSLYHEALRIWKDSDEDLVVIVANLGHLESQVGDRAKALRYLLAADQYRTVKSLPRTKKDEDTFRRTVRLLENQVANPSKIRNEAVWESVKQEVLTLVGD